jgi:HEPN domain-containing protein
MLSYYVEWHMREAWRELMCADEDLERKKHRDPVAAAVRSDAALEKVATRTLKDGSQVHSFRTLLEELSTVVRNTCEARVGSKKGSTFQMTTLPTAAQQRAFTLLQSITV